MTKNVNVGVIMAIIFGSLFVSSLVIGFIIIVLIRRNKVRAIHEKRECFEMISKRFSFEDLKIATENFSRKLGSGGFGTVYDGMLKDGTRVAVKRLNGVVKNRNAFCEVVPLGRIHHVNVMRLVGFCYEKRHRIIVYEYMCNGSLDKWIFNREKDTTLDWQTRRRIIIDIAKGLSYLHEESGEKVAHLDIKPQNILLDQDFKAKIGDFGLARIIDLDNGKLMTRMRGTPGYLAPEWQTSRVTQKADVYSFGVVVMEIVCGRKNLDYSETDGHFHLLGLLQEKVEANQLSDIIDNRSQNMQLHVNEIVKVMELAIWCLQSDSSKRPSMSVVARNLEGATNVDPNIVHNFVAPAPPIVAQYATSHTILDWILSGPR